MGELADTTNGTVDVVFCERTWLKKHSDVVVCQHMLVRSQIAKMGLAVAGLALGAVIKGYTERRAFQLALDEAIPLAKRSPGASVSA